MSFFSDKPWRSLKSTDTGKVVAKPSLVSSVTHDIHIIEPISYKKQYVVGVQLGRSVVFDNYDELQHIKGLVGRQIAEDLYGDIRKKLIEVDFKIRYGDDVEGALSILSELIEDMK